MLICCSGITSVTSTFELEEDEDEDEEGEGERKSPVVVELGCLAACNIGRAYACALRVYVVSEDILIEEMRCEIEQGGD